MAISYVGGVVAGRAGNSNTTVDVSLSSGLTGGSDGGVSAGDLVVVTVITGSANRQSVVAVTAPATYVNLTAQRTTASTYDTNLQVSYKFMPSTPDSVVTIPAQGQIADGQAYLVQVFRGVDPVTPLDVTPTYATGSGANTRPVPSDITPTTTGVWIVVTGGGSASTASVYTNTSLTNFLSAQGDDSNDGTVGGGYFAGWTSGVYTPNAFSGGTNNVGASWAATTIALRPATETQVLTPTLYNNGQTFYAPTITVGAVGLTPTLFENTNTFYSATVTQPTPSQTLTASLYENSNTFYTATLTTSITLSAALYENSSTFYQQTITTGAVTLTATLFTNDNTFYQPSVDRGAVTLSASLYSNTNEFYTADLTQGAVNLQPELFENSNAFYAANITVGEVTLVVGLFENTNTFYAANVSGDSPSQDLSAPLFVNDNVFYAPTVNVGAINISTGIFTNSNEFYTPTLSVGGVTLSLEIFVNDNSFYNHAVDNVASQELIADIFNNTNNFYSFNIENLRYSNAIRIGIKTTKRNDNISSAKRNVGVSFRQPNVVKTRR